MEKRVVSKFYKPWTGPFKVTKRLLDLTYDTTDEARQIANIINFYHLKKQL